MPERVERHGDVCVVIGQPRPDVSAGEVCPRCGLEVQEHHFRWPRAEGDVVQSLFVEACYCGVRFTDAADQPLDETPELWGVGTASAAGEAAQVEPLLETPEPFGTDDVMP